MKTNREIILNYCSTLKTHDIEYLQNAIENELYIKREEYHMLNGCPDNYGLEDYIGLCEIEDVSQDKQLEQCFACWKKALEIV